MVTERDYIIKAFKENFLDYKDKKIVIYGIGNNTKIIVDEFKEYNIIGLMDGYKTGENIFGKKVLSYNEVLKVEVDIIIIVARSSSIKIIYKRISEFCSNNGILVFDINGNDLESTLNLTIEDNRYFDVNESELKKKIIENDIISFDIFDTLLMRKVLYPKDVFELVKRNAKSNYLKQFDFVEQRIEAERQLLMHTNPTLSEIYDAIRLNTSISEDEKKYLMDLEIATEMDVLICRKKMVEILNLAIDLGKKVYLISDMYMSKQLLTEILWKNGIKGYEDIFVSCEYRTPKCQELFPIFKDAIKSESYLHIGDNKDADELFAKLNGMNTFTINSAVDMIEISSYSRILKDLNTLDERIKVGMFAAKIFNNPFELYNSKGKALINNTYDVGYLFIAPIVSNFVLWLIEKIKNEEYGHILFSARDGYLINELYDMALDILKISSDMPKSIYFYTSRMVCIASSLFTEEDIIYALKLAFDGSPELMLKKRFFLEDKEISIYKKSKYSNLQEYILSHKGKILNKSELLRNNYLKYIDSLGMALNKKIAFFDFVSSGTCQMCLKEIFSRDIVGYYFVHVFEDYYKKSELDIESLFRSGCAYEIQNYIFENYIFLENIITAPESSLCKFDEYGNKIFLEESRNETQLMYVRHMHTAIKDYFREYISINPNYIDLIDKNISDKMLSFIQSKYSLIENKVLKSDVLKDEFCNREYGIDDMLI
jgi:predicted HAD superfamily hydrolase